MGQTAYFLTVAIFIFAPAVVSGICVLLIGVVFGLLGLRLIFGLDERAAAHAGTNGRDIALGCGTLALMIGLNVWSKGALRMYCAISGIIAGYAGGIVQGAVRADAFGDLASAGIVALPKWFSHLPSFHSELLVPFAVVALASCLKAMGDISNAQRINDRDWVRPRIWSQSAMGFSPTAPGRCFRQLSAVSAEIPFLPASAWRVPPG